MKVWLRLVLAVVLVGVIVGGVWFLTTQNERSRAPVKPPVVRNGSVANASRLVVVPAASAASVAEDALYAEFLKDFLTREGGVVSTVGPVEWCPDPCAGCGGDVSSEAVALLAGYAARRGDRAVFDVADGYAESSLRHPETGLLLWKLDPSGGVGGCGGDRSMVAPDFALVGALLRAEERWPAEGFGASARRLAEALKGGLLADGYVPGCMMARGGVAAPCDADVLLDRLDLPVLASLCYEDVSWCAVHTANKALLIKAAQGAGVYDSYNAASKEWSWRAGEGATRVLTLLVLDGDSDAWAAAKPHYYESRAVLLNATPGGGSRLCETFKPDKGCVVADADVRVYADYLVMARARGDEAFADALRTVLLRKLAASEPLAGNDAVTNVRVLDALGGEA